MFHAVKVGTAHARSKNKIRREVHVGVQASACSPNKLKLELQQKPGFVNNMSSHWDHLKKLALAEVEATLAELPAPLRERAAQLPVTFEPKPNASLVADGIEADSLGLFTGPAFGDEEQSASPVPPQIILYLENLWSFTEGDEEFFLEEVYTTYLHELGHYLGLDEDDLFERGLE